jgi:polar amino acid transport system substrate-binding protein
LEHKINTKLFSMKNRGGKLAEAFISGLPFVTSGPIRYYEFQTLGGRTLSAVLAVGSTLMIASITALLASAFTLDQMRSEITGLQDLAKVKVGAMEATTSAEYLQEQGLNSRTYNDRQKLLAALDAGSLDAVVSDGAVSVLPFVFEKQNYAFALPDHSPYVEKFNQALLSVRESPVWRKELVKYFGE